MVMEKEIWKEIPDTDGMYKASNLGRYSGKMGILKNRANPKNGYIYISIKQNGVRKWCRAHRITAELFIPNPYNLPYVNHKDGNKTNNRVDNLEWCTAQYNTDYSVSKPVEQYSLDGTFIAKYKSAMEEYRQTGIHFGCIARVCKGEEGRKQAGGYIWCFGKRDYSSKNMSNSAQSESNISSAQSSQNDSMRSNVSSMNGLGSIPYQ